MSGNYGDCARMAAHLTLISHAATEALRHTAFPLDEPLEEREILNIAAIGWNAPKAQTSLCRT